MLLIIKVHCLITYVLREDIVMLNKNNSLKVETLFQDSYLTCNRINLLFVIVVIISGWEDHAMKDLRKKL